MRRPIGAAAVTTAAALITAGLLGSLLAGCGATTEMAAPETGAATSSASTGVATSAPQATPTTPDLDPPAQPPTRVVIPGIGVDAEVVGVGLTTDGQMVVPDPGLAGWYTEGPVPGNPGPGVVVAHVSTQGGPDVFARLADLRVGESISIHDAAGLERTWVVVATEQVDKDDLPTDRIWNATSDRVLRLVTCAGEIDPETGHFEDNWIVYADPVAEDL